MILEGHLIQAGRMFASARVAMGPGATVWWAYSVFYAVGTTFLFARAVWRWPSVAEGPRLRAIMLLICAGSLWFCLAPCPQTSARFRMPLEPLMALIVPIAFSKAARDKPATPTVADRS